MMATRYPKKNYEYVTGRDRRKDKMMRKKELIEILEQHKLWLSYDEEGTRADLSGANLSRADLSCANLRYANLSGAKRKPFSLKSLRQASATWGS